MRSCGKYNHVSCVPGEAYAECKSGLHSSQSKFHISATCPSHCSPPMHSTSVIVVNFLGHLLLLECNLLTKICGAFLSG